MQCWPDKLLSVALEWIGGLAVALLFLLALEYAHPYLDDWVSFLDAAMKEKK